METGTGTGASTSTVRLGTPTGRWVLAATVLGSGMGFLDATVVNVALPEMGRDLDAGVSDLQLVVNGYLFTLAALILLGGTLGDRYGRRRIFTIGVSWFTVASLGCAIAPNVGTLIAARSLQGVGAALLTPGSLAIIGASFHPEDRARAIGAWSALTGVSAAIGPLLGGYLIDAASWRWIFLINLPIGAAVMALAARHVPETRDPTVTGHLDVVGAVAATVTLASLTVVLVEGPDRGFDTPGIIAAIVIGVAAGVGFVVAERRAQSPMMPFNLLSSSQFRSANLVTFVVYGALGGVFFLFVVDLQTVLGYSPLEAGTASLPITALLLALSTRSGALAQRIGPRIPLTVGPIVVAAGMLLLARIEPGASYVTTILPGIVVFGLGLVLVVSPVTALALASVDDRHSGLASAVNNAVSRVAQLVAVAALPVVVGLTGDDYRDPEAFTNGFRTAMIVTAAVAALGGLVAWATIRSDALRDSPAAAEPHRCCGVEGAPLRTSHRHHTAA